jgi:hypothetical protein
VRHLRRSSDLIAAVDDLLQCPQCGRRRPFLRPPLLLVTGPAGHRQVHAMCSARLGLSPTQSFSTPTSAVRASSASHDGTPTLSAQILMNGDAPGSFNSGHFLSLGHCDGGDLPSSGALARSKNTMALTRVVAGKYAPLEGTSKSTPLSAMLSSVLASRIVSSHCKRRPSGVDPVVGVVFAE